jgi:hypothetical protein
MCSPSGFFGRLFPSLFPHADVEDEHKAGFGGHHIGYLGSLSLVMNNIIGPGLFALPALFQSTGWIPCLGCIALVCVLCTQSSLYLSRAMASFRDNEDFSKRLEYSITAYHTLSRVFYYLASITLVCVFFSQNLANILVTSQVMDSTLLEIFDKAYAWDYVNNSIMTVKRDADSVITDSLFGDNYVISLGYVIMCGSFFESCAVAAQLRNDPSACPPPRPVFSSAFRLAF